MADESKNPNLFFLANLNGNRSKLKIKLSKKPVPVQPLQDEVTIYLPKEGLFPVLPEDEMLLRRVETGGIEFYDLGQILQDAVFVDRFFRAPINPVRIGDEATGYIQTDDLTLDYQGDMTDEFINTIGLSNLKTTHKKIEKDNSDFFRIRLWTTTYGNQYIDSTSELWNEDGKSLKLTTDDLANGVMIQGSPFFNTTYINPINGTAKITTGPSFEDDAVEGFLVGPSAKIYLAPAPNSISLRTTGTVHYPHDMSGDFSNEHNYSLVQDLYADYMPFPRNYMASLIESWRNDAFNEFFVLQQYGFTFSLATWVLWWATRNYLVNEKPLNLTNPQLWHDMEGRITYYDGEGALITEIKRILRLSVMGNMPRADVWSDSTTEPEASTAFTPSQYMAAWSAISTSGVLLAIIEQDGTFYFVWSN